MVSPIESQRSSNKKPTFTQAFAQSKPINSVMRALAQSLNLSMAPPLNFYSSTINLSTTASVVLGKNEGRRYVMLQNIGTTTIFLGFGVQPNVSGNSSIEIPSGFQYSFEAGYCPSNEVYAITGSTGRVTVVEGLVTSGQ